MIFSENRCALFRIMLYDHAAYFGGFLKFTGRLKAN